MPVAMVMRMGVIMAMTMLVFMRLAWVRMAMGGPMFMAVVPQLGLVQQKEKHQPHQQRQEQIVGTSLAFKGLRQQVHERSCHQGPGRQAEHMLGITGKGAKTQSRCHPNAANTSS